MTLFNLAVPIFQRKRWLIDEKNRQQFLHIQIKIRGKTLFSSAYTCIDQVFILWGLISAGIFLVAQFAPISWETQAIAWSVLTVIGTIAMIAMTHNWAKGEGLSWMLYIWVILMLGGIVITDWGIFGPWVGVLIHLPHLWLGLSALGYFLTAFGMRSRAFLLAGILHLGGIGILPLVMGWQFLITGLIMMTNLLVFAETHWDDYGC